MTIRIPKKLSAGDTIGIIAPSDPILPTQMDNLHKGVAMLKELGFQVKLGAHIHSIALGYAATPQEKAEDINHMFADPEVNAIICAQGGDSANAPLPLVDWEAVRQNPKVFLGLSDITVLLNAIYAQTGLITFHGNDILWGFGNVLAEYEKQEFLRILVDGEIGPIPANQARKTVRSGQAQGTLLGGNLGCCSSWLGRLIGRISRMRSCLLKHTQSQRRPVTRHFTRCIRWACLTKFGAQLWDMFTVCNPRIRPDRIWKMSCLRSPMGTISQS